MKLDVPSSDGSKSAASGQSQGELSSAATVFIIIILCECAGFVAVVLVVMTD